MSPPAVPSRLDELADQARSVARRLDARRRTATAGGARAVLVASGLVDVGFVEAQVGRRLAGPEEAAEVVLADATLAPHPLVEVPDLRAYLRDPDARQLPTHPLLDADRLRSAVAERPELRDDPRGLVAAWLETVDDETVLPTVPAVGTVRLRRLRKVSIAAARAAAAVPEPTGQAPRVEPAEPTGQPVVSVLADVTGLGLRLRELVTHLQAQTWTAWELVAVDRGSADDTAEVLTGLAAFEPRVRPLATDHDHVAASQQALDASSGRYLAFADVERPWAADHLSRAVHHLERSTAAGVLGAAPVGRTGLVVRRADVLDGGLGLAGVPALGDAVAHDVARRLGVDLGTDPSAGDGLDVRERSTVLARHLPPVPDVARVVGRLSVVLPVRDDDVGSALRWAMAARPRRDETDVELVAVVVAGSARTRRVLGTTAGLAAHVRVAEVPDDVTTALAADVGLASATGDLVLLARPAASMERAAVEALVAALDDPAVDLAQPVVVGTDGLVLSAGASFAAGPRPAGLLAGHPVAHVAGAPVPAPFGPVVVGRTEALLAVGGLDAALPDGLAETDLGARLGGRAVVVPTALAHVAADSPDGLLDDGYLAGLGTLARTSTPSGTAEAWRAAGFDLAGRTSRPVGDAAVRVPHAVVTSSPARLAVREPAPRLLWTIDTPVPGSATDPYVGTPLARGLAAALTRLGQRVAVDPRDLRERPTRDLDDVLLVLRGGEPVAPRPGTVSVLWVVSDPHTVTADEAAQHDLVYAASTTWAAQRSRDWRIPVEPLLMATDPAVFHPTDRPAGEAGRGGLLYLGSPRHRFRSDVLPALPPDTDVSAPTQGHDDGVREALDRSSVVLFDHTHHERVAGFLGSRLFDAVASGVPVVTDRVDGTEIFGDMVLTFDQVDLVRLAAAPHEYFAQRRDRARIAREVADTHTYEARARTLLDAVLARLHAPEGTIDDHADHA